MSIQDTLDTTSSVALILSDALMGMLAATPVVNGGAAYAINEAVNGDGVNAEEAFASPTSVGTGTAAIGGSISAASAGTAAVVGGAMVATGGAIVAALPL